jgi:putative cardiolipin synthase
VSAATVPPDPARLVRRAAAALVVAVLAGCASLPTTRTLTPSYALTSGTTETILGRVAARALSEAHAASAVDLLNRGPDAFVARLALVAAAERSVDAQYYLWHGDTTGRLLISALVRAADRGVRVRLLLDDVGTAPKDRNLLVLDGHPGIEVRLFNPVADRTARKAGMIRDFSRVNRRMHNKSFTADGQVTIVGGRNIGDEYFEASPELDFGDLDALAVGAAVKDVSDQFDRYWNSPVVYGITELRKSRPTPEEAAGALAALREFDRLQQAQPYVQLLRDSGLARQLRDGRVPFTGARVRVRADDPAKAERPEDRSGNLLPQLMPELEATRRQLLLVSPYFIPRDKGVLALRAVHERGVAVRILTNSLASTDEVPVFAAYRKYRRALIDAGVEVFEVDRAATRASPPAGATGVARHGQSGGSRAHASLHAKVLVFDCTQFFVGSMNLDPRSAFTNTEVGLVVDSPELATRLCEGLERAMVSSAFRVQLRRDPSGGTETEWTGGAEGAGARFTSEPRCGWWRRFLAWFYALLPIEPLL